MNCLHAVFLLRWKTEYWKRFRYCGFGLTVLEYFCYSKLHNLYIQFNMRTTDATDEFS